MFLEKAGCSLASTLYTIGESFFVSLVNNSYIGVDSKSAPKVRFMNLLDFIAEE